MIMLGLSRALRSAFNPPAYGVIEHYRRVPPGESDAESGCPKIVARARSGWHRISLEKTSYKGLRPKARPGAVRGSWPLGDKRMGRPNKANPEGKRGIYRNIPLAHSALIIGPVFIPTS